MKVDKLLCKKSINYEDSLYHFGDYAKPIEKGKEYVITFIDHKWYNDSIGVSVEDMEFHVEGSYWMMLWSYFYTPQEMRKLKLKQISKL